MPLLRHPRSALAACSLALAALASCDRSDPPYSQASPEALAQTASAMVRDGNARLLSRLVFADSVELRAVLNRLGELLGSLQRLAREVEQAMPAEVAQLRARNADPKLAGTSLLQSVTTGRLPTRERGGPDGPPPVIQNALYTLLADPFAWIDSNAKRVTFVSLADDLVAIQVDGQPALAPIGLTLRRSGDEWFLVLPLNLPFLSNYLPQTRQEWSIAASLIRVANSVVSELADDVSSGRVRTLDALARRAGEKAFGPAAMVFIVYQREMTVRARREPLVTDLRRRLDRWVDERTDAADLPANSPEREAFRLLAKRAAALINQAALAPLDARARTELASAPTTTPARPNRREFQNLSRATLETQAEEWLTAAGIPLDLGAPLEPAPLDRAEKAAADRREGRSRTN